MAARVAISGSAATCVLSLTAAAMVLLSVQSAAAIEARDECLDAATISTVQFEETVDTSRATTGVDDPLQSCPIAGPSQNAHSVWYRYVAPATGTLSVAADTMP